MGIQEFLQNLPTIELHHLNQQSTMETPNLGFGTTQTENSDSQVLNSTILGSQQNIESLYIDQVSFTAV